MSADDFQLLDDEPFDNSIVKRDFLKVYRQQGANLNDSDQQVEFIFGENNKYHQIGNAYFEYDITVEDPNAASDYRIRIILTNNALAYIFQKLIWLPRRDQTLNIINM